MNIPNPTGSITDALRQFYTINDNLRRVSEDIKEMKAEMSALRAENSDLKSRVAVLEKAQQMVDMQVELAITKTIAKLEIEFARQQAATRPILPTGDEAD